MTDFEKYKALIKRLETLPLEGDSEQRQKEVDAILDEVYEITNRVAEKQIVEMFTPFVVARVKKALLESLRQRQPISERDVDRTRRTLDENDIDFSKL